MMFASQTSTKSPAMHAGIVGVVQYHHTEISARKTPRKGSAGSRDAASAYELVLAVSSIRMQVYGEDFQDFMHRGATQCSSFHAYMDLFCYQAPSSRLPSCSALPAQFSCGLPYVCACCLALQEQQAKAQCTMQTFRTHAMRPVGGQITLVLGHIMEQHGQEPHAFALLLQEAWVGAASTAAKLQDCQHAHNAAAEVFQGRGGYGGVR